MPAYASETQLSDSKDTGNDRGSLFFGSSSVYIWITSENSFEVWFDVGAMSTMQKLGASSIKVQKSTDGGSWVTMYTYTMDRYSNMVATNVAHHASCIEYIGTPGCSYRAIVVLYAQNSRGTGEMTAYTAVKQL